MAAAAAAPALASKSTLHASTASTSRWWKLSCDDAAAPCAFTVKLHGAIDESRLHLLRRALERRDKARRALGRDVALRIDVDSQGGQVFAAMEIGRILRAERASIAVRDGASCVSACVLLLIGATQRSVGAGARVAIHRPSLGASGRGGPRAPGEDATVAAMTESLVQYAQQMNVPRGIIDAMMSIPPDRLRLLNNADLIRYGIVLR